MSELDKILKPFGVWAKSLEIDVGGGTSINEACRMAVGISCLLNVPVKFSFNDTEMFANTDTSVSDLLKHWQKERNHDPR